MKNEKTNLILSALASGFSLFFHNIGKILLVLLCLAGAYIIIGITTLFQTSLVTFLIAGWKLLQFPFIVFMIFAFLLLLSVITAMMYTLYLKAMLLVHDQKPITQAALTANISWLTTFSGLALYVMLFGLGLALLFIPGLIFITRYYFFPYLLIGEKLSIKESFSKSAVLTHGMRLRLLALWIFTSMINKLFILMPATTLANIDLFRKLHRAEHNLSH